MGIQWKENFWEECWISDVIINLSIYPPLFNKNEQILELIEEKGVEVILRKTDIFFVRTNINGDSDPFKAKSVFCIIKLLSSSSI